MPTTRPAIAADAPAARRCSHPSQPAEQDDATRAVRKGILQGRLDVSGFVESERGPPGAVADAFRGVPVVTVSEVRPDDTAACTPRSVPARVLPIP